MNQWTPRKSGRQKKLRLWIIRGVCIAVLIFCVWQLVAYFASMISSNRQAEEMREIYHADATQAQETASTPEAAAAPEATAVPTEEPENQEGQEEQEEQTAAVPGTLSSTAGYPDNPNRMTGSRFPALIAKNSDIVAWLTIEDVVDQAVVLRNNTYYLTHDYLGHTNTNGAIFLDENASLYYRPWVFLLFGHNMKTGAMFGNLYRYDGIDYYRQHAFVQFDTLFEEGKFVIFSVGTIDLENNGYNNYVDVYGLYSTTVSVREEVIAQLQRASTLDIPIDVQADDQLLLLITCNGHDNERYVVAARRIRSDESEKDVQQQVSFTGLKH